MVKRGSRALLGVLGLAALLWSGEVRAEDAEAVRRELDIIRQQFDQMKQQYEQRLRELGDRLQTLETQKAAPPPATPVAPTAPEVQAGPAVTTPTEPTGPSLMEYLRPRQPFSLAQPGRQLLFDIGVVGDFVADFTSARVERNREGTFEGRENRVFPQHIELLFFGRVDPYASALVRVAAAEEGPENGEREAEVAVRLEEAHVELLTLPLGTIAKGGVMRPRFGTLNTLDQESVPQVDRPEVTTLFFGEEGLIEKGLELRWVLPFATYNEVSAGVFNGDNESAFGRGTLRKPLVLGRLRTFFELDRWGGLQLDFSGASGVDADEDRNTIAGFGAKYKWQPLIGYAFPIFTLAGEVIYGNRRVSFHEDAENGEEPEVLTRRFERVGYYVYGQYDWSRRWAAGVRWDWSEFPTDDGHQWAVSPYLQFKTTEFLRFRVQYKHSDGRGEVARRADEVFLQGVFLLGAHPTERF